MTNGRGDGLTIETSTKLMRGIQWKLTPEEKELLPLYLREGNLTVLATTLGVSVNTARNQRTSIMRKLCMKHPIELTMTTTKRGMVHLELRKETKL